MEKSTEEHSPIHISSEKGLEKAERLAPLEERQRGGEKPVHQSLNNEGVISVDTGDLKFPKGFTGEKDGRSWLFGVEPITIIIITFTLAFIAFIAYLISVEPPKTKDEPPPAAVEDKP